MRFRPRVRPEKHLEPARSFERHNPFTEKEIFYREHVDLDMEMKEIRLLFALAKDGADVQADLTKFSDDVLQKLIARFGENTPELEQAKKYLLERVLPASMKFADEATPLGKLQDSFFRDFLLTSTLEEHFRQKVNAGRERVASVNDFFEKFPTYKSDLDKIGSKIQKALETNSVKQKKDEIEFALVGFVKEVKQLNLEPELQEALFSSIAEKIALAWGHDPLVAESMSKNFMLVSQLGYGTNGEAYSALNSEGELVAMKILSPRNPKTNERLGLIDRDAARQFQRELYVLETVKGVHIVEHKDGEIIPTGKDDEGNILNTGWIAMEYLEGGDLKDKIESRGKFSIQEAVDLTIQLSKGLDVLHKAGITHRDIKPQNIMLDESSGEPIAKIIDFGTAINVENPFDVDKDADDQGIYGTPFYIAPEVFLTGEISEKADIFSLGIILYELLTEIHPFVDKLGKKNLDMNTILLDIDGNTAIDPAMIRSGISPELKRILLAMIDKDPNNRPTAEQVIRQLSQVVSERQIMETRNKMAETKSIPAYGKSEVLKTAERSSTERIEKPSTKKEVLSLEEIAAQVVEGISYTILTRKLFQIELEKSLGAKVKKEDIDELLAYLKSENIIQDNASSREGYVIVKNYEKSTQDEASSIPKAEVGSTDIDFDDFDETFPPEDKALYEEQGVSLDLARQFLSANENGTVGQLQNDLSMSADATRQLLEKLNEEKFLLFDSEKGTYLVGGIAEESRMGLDEFDRIFNRYETEGVSLDLARQFLSANKRGTMAELQNDLSLSAGAVEQLLKRLDREKFLSFDPENGTYIVGRPKPKSFFTRIRNFFN